MVHQPYRHPRGLEQLSGHLVWGESASWRGWWQRRGGRWGGCGILWFPLKWRIIPRWTPWPLSLCSLHWRHNDHDSVSNHQPHGCFLNRLFRRRSKKTSKLRVTGLCVGNSPGPVNSPHKGQLRGKCFHLMTSSCDHPQRPSTGAPFTDND